MIVYAVIRERDLGPTAQVRDRYWQRPRPGWLLSSIFWGGSYSAVLGHKAAASQQLRPSLQMFCHLGYQVGSPWWCYENESLRRKYKEWQGQESIAL